MRRRLAPSRRVLSGGSDTMAYPKPPASLSKLIARYDASAIDLPGGRARVRLAVTDLGDWDALLNGVPPRLESAVRDRHPDARLSADRATWARIAADVRGGMEAWSRGRLAIRGSLHLGIGWLAATSGIEEEGRLVFESVDTPIGPISTVAAGRGDPVLCLHGLGGTKASFMSTVAALAGSHRVVAVDLPGFGESAKPIGAPYHAPWFARSAIGLMDALGLERAHLIGNSMGGRVALEAGLRHPDRVGRIVALAPALAFLSERPWAPFLRLVRPELGLLQMTPRAVTEQIVRRLVPGASDGWSAAGVDEFLRSYLTPRGRAAFYAAARNIYLDEPHGEKGFWTRLAGLQRDTMFVWGRQDRLVPVAFRRHVERALPRARHVELDCGHVPQVEAPGPTHAAIAPFLAAAPLR